MVKPGYAEKLEAYVKAGGTLVGTYFSGIVDETDLAFLNGYPGPLSNLFGIWVEETDALSPTENNRANMAGIGSHECGLLCDIVHLRGAKALGQYESDFYAGKPALTVNEFGNGKAYYFATCLSNEGTEAALESICSNADVVKPLDVPRGFDVEVVTRVAPGGEEQTYLLNHATTAIDVPLRPGKYVDLLSGEEFETKAAMPAVGVRILVKKG
jgi:beta-galactosidase